MADISKIKTPDGTTYNIKDATARSQSGVTGVKGNAESSYRTGNVNLTAANVGAAPSSHTQSADTITSGYLNIHPENSPVLIPFMHNDIAHLLSRGGSATVIYDGVVQSQDISACFDGSGSYWAINPTGITTLVIELTLHKAFGWTNWVYADFGNVSWRASGIKIEVMNSTFSEDTWTQKYSTTSNSLGHISVSIAHTPSGASNSGWGFNKLRYTFTDMTVGSATIFRLSQLGIYNYGSTGLRETYMSRGVDDYVFRSITPNANNTYALGNTSHKWSNVYATTFTGNVTGNVSGTAANVTGVVAVANGGTGQTSAKNAANAFMNALDTGSSTPVDADYYISQYVGGGTTTKTYHRRPVSALWEYIKGKISSVLGLTNTNYGGTSAKATADASGNTITSYYAPKSTAVTNVALSTNKITKTINGTTTDVVTAATTSVYGITKLSTSTSSTATDLAATPSAVRAAYNLANGANTTANTALSGVNGTLIYDHTYSITNGVATFVPHVYLKGEEVTSNYAASCFTWKYRLSSTSSGTPSYINLTTDSTTKGCTVAITTLGYGGYVLGTFTPPAS